MSRYFHPSENILLTSNRYLIESIHRVPAQSEINDLTEIKAPDDPSHKADLSPAAIATGSGYIPVTPFKTISDEIQAIKASADAPVETLSSMPSSRRRKSRAVVITESSLYNDLSMSLSKYLNSLTKGSVLSQADGMPTAAVSMQLKSWLHVIHQQSLLYKYQMVGSNSKTFSLSLTSKYSSVERKFVVEKKISMYEEAIKRHNESVQRLVDDMTQKSTTSMYKRIISTIHTTKDSPIKLHMNSICGLSLLYESYIQYFSSFATQEMLLDVWKRALDDCPLSASLLLHYASRLRSFGDKDIVVNRLRQDYLEQYDNTIKKVRISESSLKSSL